MRRTLLLGYGILSYLTFLVTFAAFVGFVGNLTPTALDAAPGSRPLVSAVAGNAFLLILFGIQHSLMARPAWKRLLVRWIPAPAERSTYVLASSLALALLIREWSPLGGVIWQIQDAYARFPLYVAFAFGWGLMLLATLQIDHLDLFGLRQVWCAWRGRRYCAPGFTEPWLYAQVRHPLHLGLLIALWSTPTMTWSHLAFAGGLTVYVLLGLRLEERDLVAAHREYRTYQARVPRFIPRLRRGSARTRSPVRSPAQALRSLRAP